MHLNIENNCKNAYGMDVFRLLDIKVRKIFLV